MTAFVLAVAFTIGVSFFCSMMEALILSTTVSEVEALKKSRPNRGLLLEELKSSMGDTISTILTLNTVANTLGATLVGGLATKLFGEVWLGVVSGAMTLAILVFSEIIPKNLGMVYRVQLQPHVVYLLTFLTKVFRPLNYLADLTVKLVIRNRPAEASSDEEIILLAERGAKEGTLTSNESDMITNALTLDEVKVGDIMTPRTVVTALENTSTVAEVFTEYPNIPFARLPVYKDNIDEVIGLVRRRDLLKAKANDRDTETVESLMQEIHFLPETVSASNALQLFLRTHQQLAMVADEFGSIIGVLTMEDVMETILGREIFEKDDVAVDMRELARLRGAQNLSSSSQ